MPRKDYQQFQLQKAYVASVIVMEGFCGVPLFPLLHLASLKISRPVRIQTNTMQKLVTTLRLGVFAFSSNLDEHLEIQHVAAIRINL